MKEIDDNLKAKFADYLNGKKVRLSDDELALLSEDDDLAKECLEIADISSEYDKEETKRGVKTFKLNVLLFSVAACLLVALVVTVFYDSNHQATTSVVSLDSNSEADKGWGELSSSAAHTLQTASVNSSSGFYTAAPDTPFEVEPAQQEKIVDNDIVRIYTAENPMPIMQTKVKSEKNKEKNGSKKVKKIKFEDGLAEGLYEYRIFHNEIQIDQGGIVIGED